MIAPGESSSFRNKVIKVFQEQFNQSDQNKTNINNNENQSKKINNLNETLKLEIVNKGNSFKRDYKLTANLKYEHFYDYFSSELRACGLLHDVDDNIDNIVTNKEILQEQIFKVRDILINHIDQNYHSKVMHLKDPAEILKKLKEIKRCEVNVNSHTVRKQIHSMQYIIGKSTAGEFCEKFEDTIRNYENSPGVTHLSDDEKRDAFYNAVMISVPTIQTIFLFQKTPKVKALVTTS